MNTNKSWYKNGLKFKCQNCGRCCFGFPGFVKIETNEIKKISKFLKISKNIFLKKYTRIIYDDPLIKNFISLKELPAPSYECIFFKDKKCTIYKVRPLQCSSYPFWNKNLISKKIWKMQVEKYCIGTTTKENISHSFDQIEQIAKNL